MDNQPIINTEGSNQIELNGVMLNSPGLKQFRLNPFRVLRIPVTATYKQAIWQAEHLVSLSHMDMLPQEPDLLPWLPGNDEMEIKQAAQKMSESLQRAVEQLLWFDLIRDPKGGIISKGLIETDTKKLWDFIQVRDLELTLESLSSLQEKETQRLTTVFAHCLNQANLRLLLALSLLYGIGPQINANSSPNNRKNHKRLTFCWKKESHCSSVINPHELIDNSNNIMPMASSWKELWTESLNGWSKIMNNPFFSSYLGHIFEEPGDERLDKEVIDTVIYAIPTRLSDILAGEIKNSLNAGANKEASILVGIAAESLLGRKAWKTSSNALRYFFQTELSELDCLIEAESMVTPGDIKLYFNRVVMVKRKWEQIDPNNVLGLSKLVEDALLKGFNLITSFEPSRHHSRAIDSLLETAIENTITTSLKEKISSYRTQIGKFYQNAFCLFCEQRKSNPKYPSVIKGKKETDREEFDTFKRIHYTTRWITVPRCEKCASFHQFVIDNTFWFCVILILAAFIATIGLQLFIRFGSIATRAIIIIVGIIFALRYLSSYIKKFTGDFYIPGTRLRWLQKIVLYILSVPMNKSPHYKIKKTKAYKNLISSGYNIEETYFSKNALKKIPKDAKNAE
jgi:hypothetical protein